MLKPYQQGVSNGPWDSTSSYVPKKEQKLNSQLTPFEEFEAKYLNTSEFYSFFNESDHEIEPLPSIEPDSKKQKKGQIEKGLVKDQGTPQQESLRSTLVNIIMYSLFVYLVI